MPLAVTDPARDVGRHCGLCLTWIGGGKKAVQTSASGMKGEELREGVGRKDRMENKIVPEQKEKGEERQVIRKGYL